MAKSIAALGLEPNIGIGLTTFAVLGVVEPPHVFYESLLLGGHQQMNRADVSLLQKRVARVYSRRAQDAQNTNADYDGTEKKYRALATKAIEGRATNISDYLLERLVRPYR